MTEQDVVRSAGIQQRSSTPRDESSKHPDRGVGTRSPIRGRRSVATLVAVALLVSACSDE